MNAHDVHEQICFNLNVFLERQELRSFYVLTLFTVVHASFISYVIINFIDHVNAKF